MQDPNQNVAQLSVITTLIGTVQIWQDPPLADEALRRWVAGRPPGSVSPLSPQEAPGPLNRWMNVPPRWVRSRRDVSHESETSPKPFDAFPPKATSLIWHVRPDRWRVETTGEGGLETGVLVIDGGRGEFALASRSDDGTERMDAGKTSPLGLHAIVAGMIDAEQILGLMNLERAGAAVHAGRQCTRAIGSLLDPDAFPVWPADSYDLLVDNTSGIILRFEAGSAEGPIAGAEFTALRVGAPIAEDTFTLSAPRGAA